jgi:hypothetical protein
MYLHPDVPLGHYKINLLINNLKWYAWIIFWSGSQFLFILYLSYFTKKCKLFKLSKLLTITIDIQYTFKIKYRNTINDVWFFLNGIIILNKVTN